MLVLVLVIQIGILHKKKIIFSWIDTSYIDLCVCTLHHTVITAASHAADTDASDGMVMVMVPVLVIKCWVLLLKLKNRC